MNEGYTMKPIIENHEMIWISDNCECGCNEVRKNGDTWYCSRCGRERK